MDVSLKYLAIYVVVTLAISPLLVIISRLYKKRLDAILNPARFDTSIKKMIDKVDPHEPNRFL